MGGGLVPKLDLVRQNKTQGTQALACQLEMLKEE